METPYWSFCSTVKGSIMKALVQMKIHRMQRTLFTRGSMGLGKVIPDGHRKCSLEKETRWNHFIRYSFDWVEELKLNVTILLFIRKFFIHSGRTCLAPCGTKRKRECYIKNMVLYSWLVSKILFLMENHMLVVHLTGGDWQLGSRTSYHGLNGIFWFGMIN